MIFKDTANFFEKGKGPWDIEDPKENENEKKPEKNPEKETEEFFKKLFGEKTKKGSGGGKGKNKKNNKKSFKLPKKDQKNLISLIIAAIFLLWLSTGIYKINPDENGVILYFGKFHSITQPGLHFYFPQPIGKLEKISVTTINKEEFGFSSINNQKRKSLYRNYAWNQEAESIMLTGDENIADIDFEVQWKVGNAKHYLFNIANPRSTIRKATESAMREIIAKRPINDALADKKSDIEREVKILLQNILDSYQSGIEIALVQLLRVDPPKEVINSFRDVQTAKADKERKINEAEAYRNDVIPRARGEAEKIIQEAEAYKRSVITNAEGQVSRFNDIYREYRRARTVTKKRIYLETMEEIYSKANKIVIDDKIGRNILPYLPLENKNITPITK